MNKTNDIYNVSQIDWCDVTWNPWTGCNPVSPGCEHCWAEKLITTRLKHKKRFDNENPFKITIHQDRLNDYANPRKGLHGKSVFVCSQSDFYHPDIPDDVRTGVMFDIIKNTKIRFYILTKRVEEALRYYTSNKTLSELSNSFYIWGRDHIWQGLTICNQTEADNKIDDFKKLPFKNKFLCMEPLLGPVDLSEHLKDGLIKWVIVGGESGSKARPMHPDWVRTIRDHCEKYKVPFYFKQWGAWVQEDAAGETVIYPDGKICTRTEYICGKSPACEKAVAIVRLTKNKAGYELDGKTYRDKC